MVEHTQHTVSFPRRKVVLLLRVSWAHSLVSKYPNAVPCQCFRQDLQSVCPTRCALRWKKANNLFWISLRESTTILLNPNLILSCPFKVFFPTPILKQFSPGEKCVRIQHLRSIYTYTASEIDLYISLYMLVGTTVLRETAGLQHPISPWKLFPQFLVCKLHNARLCDIV